MKKFIVFFASKTGAPLLAASVVACLIQGSPTPIHFVLTGTAAVLIAIDYKYNA